MRWSDEASGAGRITGLRRRTEEDETVLTWNWPQGVGFVYIYLFPAEAEQPLEERPTQAMKLLTREEYKTNAGYRVRLGGIGSYGCRVYPCERNEDGVVLLRQEDEDNMIRFSTGKARIRYSIRYGSGLFRKTRPVRIELTSETAVPKEALCYVIKEGALPLHREDGTAYPFIADIASGRNALPAIEVPKQHRIRLFLTDGRTYGERYELIPE